MNAALEFLIELTQAFNGVATFRHVFNNPYGAACNGAHQIDRSRLKAAPEQRSVTTFHAALKLNRLPLGQQWANHTTDLGVLFRRPPYSHARLTDKAACRPGEQFFECPIGVLKSTVFGECYSHRSIVQNRFVLE